MHDPASWFRKTWFTRRRVRELKNAHNSVTVQNRTRVFMNFFHHKDLGNHLLQLCPKVVKHPVFLTYYLKTIEVLGFLLSLSILSDKFLYQNSMPLLFPMRFSNDIYCGCEVWYLRSARGSWDSTAVGWQQGTEVCISK